MAFKKRHGMSGTRIHNIYLGILNRCNCRSMTGYENYGGRGIKCLRKSFEEFYRDMGESYDNHVKQFGEKNTTIDRIDVNGNYCKQNCRWATQKEQVNNTRVNVHMEYKGKKYPSIQLLCEDLGIRYKALYKRIFLDGQDSEEAIDGLLRKANKYKYKGITYRGITDMCRKLGLNRTSINYRLKIGMSIDEAIEKDFRPYCRNNEQNQRLSK